MKRQARLPLKTLNYTALADYGKYSVSFSNLSPAETSLVSLLGMAIVGMFVIGGATKYQLPLLILACALLGIVVWMFVRKMNLNGKKTKALIQRFADDNGFITREVQFMELRGSLFHVGRSQVAWTAIEGELGEFPFSFFEYAYTIGGGKTERTVFTTVMEVVLPQKFPQLVLDSLVEAGGGVGNRSTLPILYKPSQRIELEGDFSQYFAVYAPETYSEEALVILTPDVMVALLQYATDCDMEIIENRLYFYWPGTLNNLKAFQNKIETAQNMLHSMKRELLSKAASLPLPSAERVSIAAAPDEAHLQKIKYHWSWIWTIIIVYLFSGIVIAPFSAFGETFNGCAPIIVIVLIGGILLYQRRQRFSRLEKHDASWGGAHPAEDETDWIVP